MSAVGDGAVSRGLYLAPFDELADPRPAVAGTRWIPQFLSLRTALENAVKAVPYTHLTLPTSYSV